MRYRHPSHHADFRSFRPRAARRGEVYPPAPGWFYRASARGRMEPERSMFENFILLPARHSFCPPASGTPDFS
ncbi:hypothetical protein GDI0270 [Gluconacetobacter diazotrophicus PA1 5]|uniref:Uncharacterized protein n=1 Tax=Gluconacetobacter diazotrophicus (strain ATCC 49037 / DSM 5601 / CCUG 37298 / CIP 103539 / LMG 7603 / PAl5) TaxID=272568 RepID=A9H2X5_GLUDA|nr:hypothetical protein GDI0270 [Gluconacetobacter diazotrophicus PA1 5]